MYFLKFIVGTYLASFPYISDIQCKSQDLTWDTDVGTEDESSAFTSGFYWMQRCSDSLQDERIANRKLKASNTREDYKYDTIGKILRKHLPTLLKVR